MGLQTNPEVELAEQYINSTHTSIFLTGKAGTGKTTFLHHLVQTVNKRCVVLAPTGVAAVNAGGVTIHSFFQLPFCPYLPDIPELVTEYQIPESRKQVRKEKLRIIRTLDLLIIDEISMVRADLLDAVDNTLQRYRRSSRPFGGVQLLMIGDVQQLPPVVTDDEKQYMDRVYPSPFFFHSKALQRLSYITIELKTIYRQQDAQFVRLLNNIRDNKFDPETLTTLNSRYQATLSESNQSEHNDTSPSAHAIRLTTHNRQADSINQKRMEELKTPPHVLHATIERNFPESAAPTDTDLLLKEGAQVMFVKNDTSGKYRYYNGKIGIVQHIEKSDDGWTILVKDEDGQTISVDREQWDNIKYEIDPADNQIKQKIDGTFVQYPLKAAWAITIHKAQGLTFDHVIVDAGQAFAYGQVYVALSRCRTFEGLELSSPITDNCAFDNRDVVQFNQTFATAQQAAEQLPANQVHYYFDLLFELYDFGPVERHLSRLNRIFQDRLKGTYPEQAQKISLLLTNEVTDLVSVGEKFRNQLLHIEQTGEQNSNRPLEQSDGATTGNESSSESYSVYKPQDDPFLKERTQKAAHYFRGLIDSVAATILPLLEVEINSKQVLKDFRDVAENFSETIGIKQTCLQIVEREGFSSNGYLKAKTDYQLDTADAQKPERKKKAPIDLAAIYSDNHHPQLVAMLSRWRTEKYQELNVPAYCILKQNTLLAIADQLPKNLFDLQKVPGLGAGKSKQFGEEILRVIGLYCDKNGISFVHAAPQPTLTVDEDWPPRPID